MSSQSLAGFQMLYYLTQVIYWIGMLVFAGYAVAQFKRWVNFQLGVGHSGQLRKAEGAEPASTGTISVEEFVD